jgi:hypothetical protein
MKPPIPPAVFLPGLVLVSVILGVGVCLGVSQLQESSNTTEAEGTIVDFERLTSDSKEGGRVGKPIAEYHVGGQTYRCTGALASNWPIFAIGQKVSILYKIDDPKVAFIDSFVDRWLCPLLFNLGGLVFLVLLVVAKIRS